MLTKNEIENKRTVSGYVTDDGILDIKRIVNKIKARLDKNILDIVKSSGFDFIAELHEMGFNASHPSECIELILDLYRGSSKNFYNEAQDIIKIEELLRDLDRLLEIVDLEETFEFHEHNENLSSEQAMSLLCDEKITMEELLNMTHKDIDEKYTETYLSDLKN